MKVMVNDMRDVKWSDRARAMLEFLQVEYEEQLSEHDLKEIENLISTFE